MTIANGLAIICQPSQNCYELPLGQSSIIFRTAIEVVKRYMNSQSDKEEAAGTVFKASLPFLKSDECEKVKGQLSYIVQDMKEERQQSRSRGFHM